jgi:Zn-dependent peptidase ImmA (M78 family)
MGEVPKDFKVISDYRRLPGEVAGVQSPKLRYEIRLAYQRREAALQLADDAGEELPPFELDCTADDDPETVGARLRNELAVTPERQLQWTDPGAAWRGWRAHLEARGVLVFLATALPMADARGFSIADRPLPVVVVNRKDHPHPRIFTLLHEAAHLMLRRSGICDIDDDLPRPVDVQRIEVFCNAVAAATLLPRDLLLSDPAVVEHRPGVQEWSDTELADIATRFRCSREVILRRLLKFGRTTTAFYRERRDRFEREYRELAKRQRQQAAAKPMKRNVPAETVSALGRPLLSLALENYHRRRLTLNALSDLLDVRARHIPKIELRLRGAR